MDLWCSSTKFYTHLGRVGVGPGLIHSHIGTLNSDIRVCEQARQSSQLQGDKGDQGAKG